MKPTFYKPEMGDMERICTWEGSTGSCLVSLSFERDKELITYLKNKNILIDGVYILPSFIYIHTYDVYIYKTKLI